jgi:hypothetical protein
MYFGAMGNNLNNDHQNWLLSFLHQDGKHPHLPLFLAVTPKLAHQVKLQQNTTSPCYGAPWSPKKGAIMDEVLCLLSPIALIKENNCSNNCFIEIGGNITSGCVLLTLDKGFKSCFYYSTSKFVKRSPKFSTFVAS